MGDRVANENKIDFVAAFDFSEFFRVTLEPLGGGGIGRNGLVETQRRQGKPLAQFRVTGLGVMHAVFGAVQVIGVDPRNQRIGLGHFHLSFANFVRVFFAVCPIAQPADDHLDIGAFQVVAQLLNYAAHRIGVHFAVQIHGIAFTLHPAEGDGRQFFTFDRRTDCTHQPVIQITVRVIASDLATLSGLPLLVPSADRLTAPGTFDHDHLVRRQCLGHGRRE